MGCEVVSCVPFYAADVWRCWDGWAITWEVSGAVGSCWVGVVGEGNNVGMVEEDPEDFFCDIENLVAPDAVRSGVIDGRYEAWGLSFFWLGGIP